MPTMQGPSGTCGSATERSPACARPVGHRRLQQVHRRAADEVRHEDVGGPLVHVLRRPHLLQLARRHDRDPVAERHRLDLVVGHVDRRDVQSAGAAA